MHSLAARAGTAARFLLIPLAAAVTAAGCAVGPDSGPAVVRGGGSKGTPTSESAKPKTAALPGIKSDLNWRDCPASMAARYGITPAPRVEVRCATVMTAANPTVTGSESVSIPLVRLRMPDTPKDAAPIVAVTGTDLPAGQFGLALAGGPAGAQLLAKHPVVAVEQRGIADIDCMTRADRAVLADNGQTPSVGTTGQSQVSRVATAARSAADSCTDTLDRNALSFTYALSATDLEALRAKWGLEKMAVLGVGTGAQVALSYAAQYANRTGRLILDTPTPFTGTAKDRASVRVRGVEQALDTFTRRCTTNPECAGKVTDPTAVLASVLDKAATGKLKELNAAGVVDAVTLGIGLATDSAQLRDLVAALAAADRGDTAALASLSRRTAAVQGQDGILVGRCNNVTGTAGLNEIEALATDWSKQYPLVGPTEAVALAQCTGWGTTTAPAAPAAFEVPPLVFGAGGDPVNGSDPANLNRVFIDAQTQPTTVSWDGVGYSVVAHSTCAAQVVDDYLGPDGLSGDRTRACPAE
ncbi:alpha/beta hydrolase [Gordonia sp. X0973]|uniref:alpha/beta fold hydrolase n=1 Tax=Gordonia sp. X0973 TaxID=2742602 RepID=UPI0013EAC2ED|nr:alpha/beta hydrolase [Gordonia sp. X0973]QKT07239.1 alpha/beta hydrolase [Gordonia sp. X0973]